MPAPRIKVIDLHSQETPIDIIQEAQGFFTGGDNTFLLVSQHHEMRLMSPLVAIARHGDAYLGTSACSNIAGINMKTINDKPVVYPPSFEMMGLVPFDINPHYIDRVENTLLMGPYTKQPDSCWPVVKRFDWGQRRRLQIRLQLGARILNRGNFLMK